MAGPAFLCLEFQFPRARGRIAVPSQSALGVRRGCVIFGGNNELKTLLQWIDATFAGRGLHYKAFSDVSLSDMQDTIAQIRKKFRSVKNPFLAIVKCVGDRPRKRYRSWSLWQAPLGMQAEEAQ